ncbi:hypothetical protein [Paenibacillus vulneris]|uniref:Uncharacterized protein n=1 Tax=Paenibacillus vulneris TaxID=1133364 RepID=A0ABW3UIZ9_9BACL
MDIRNNILAILKKSFDGKERITCDDLENAATQIRAEVIERKLIPFLNVSTRELELVDVSNVLYVQLPKPKSKYLVYTQDGIFEQITKGSGIEPLFFDPDIFIVVDSKTSVNRFKVKKYDSYRFRLYFSECVDESSIYVQAFQKVVNEFASELGKHNDVSEVGQYTLKGFVSKLSST